MVSILNNLATFLQGLFNPLAAVAAVVAVLLLVFAFLMASRKLFMWALWAGIACGIGLAGAQVTQYVRDFGQAVVH